MATLPSQFGIQVDRTRQCSPMWCAMTRATIVAERDYAKLFVDCVYTHPADSSKRDEQIRYLNYWTAKLTEWDADRAITPGCT